MAGLGGAGMYAQMGLREEEVGRVWGKAMGLLLDVSRG